MSSCVHSPLVLIRNTWFVRPRYRTSSIIFLCLRKMKSTLEKDKQATALLNPVFIWNSDIWDRLNGTAFFCVCEVSGDGATWKGCTEGRLLVPGRAQHSGKSPGALWKVSLPGTKVVARASWWPLHIHARSPLQRRFLSHFLPQGVKDWAKHLASGPLKLDAGDLRNAHLLDSSVETWRNISICVLGFSTVHMHLPERQRKEEWESWPHCSPFSSVFVLGY